LRADPPKGGCSPETALSGGGLHIVLRLNMNRGGAPVAARLRRCRIQDQFHPLKRNDPLWIFIRWTSR
jgi:hypothetical protein